MHAGKAQQVLKVLCLNSGEQLQIERISGETPGGLDLSQYLDVPKENTDTDAAENKGGNAGSGSTAGDTGGHMFHAGDTLPLFAEGTPFTFTLLDRGGSKTDSRTVIFLYTENVPSCTSIRRASPWRRSTMTKPRSRPKRRITASA
jgi:hypothetical protein